MKKFKILRESDSRCRREGEYYNSKLNPRDRRAAEGIDVTDYTNDKLRVGNDEFVYFYVCKDDGSFCDASGKPFKSDDDARKYVACLCDYDASEVAHELNKILGNVYHWDMFRRPNKITENKNYNTMKRYIIKKRTNSNGLSESKKYRVTRDVINEGMSFDEFDYQTNRWETYRELEELAKKSPYFDIKKYNDESWPSQIRDLLYNVNSLIGQSRDRHSDEYTEEIIKDLIDKFEFIIRDWVKTTEEDKQRIEFSLNLLKRYIS